MSRVFGIIEGMNEGENLVEFGCRIKKNEIGITPVFDVIGNILEMPLFWDANILSPACYSFWSRSHRFNSHRITVYEKNEVIVPKSQAGNIHSLQLAVCMAPIFLSTTENMNIKYQNLFFSGTIHSSGELRAGEVMDCQEKYELLLSHQEFISVNETSAFIYVSKNEIKAMGAIIAIRIEPGSPVTDIIFELSGAVIYHRNEGDIFKASTANYIRKIFSGTNEIIHFNWYFSTTFLYKYLFFFDILRELVEQEKMFTIDVFLPAAVLGIDIVRDNVSYIKPAWYEKMELEKPDEVIKANGDLLILRELIINERKILQRLFFIYNQHRHRRLKLLITEDRLQQELMSPNGENMLYITFGSNNKKRQYLIFTSEQGLGFSDMGKKDINIFFKNKKEIFCPKEENRKDETRLVLIGPPGIGKTSVAKLLAPKNKKILSTDPFINDHLFNDGTFFPEDEWYTREVFEGKDSNISELEKDKRDEQIIPIRELGVEIMLRMAIATGDFADLDGKAILSPNIQYFLRNHNFIIVLLIPKLTEIECIGKNTEEIKNAEFEEYYKLFRNNGEYLLDRSKRRNICVVMDKAKCKKFEELKYSIHEKTSTCGTCKWFNHSDCKYKIEGEEMWQRFHDGLYREIWMLRYHYYHAACDICINAREGMTIDEIVFEIGNKLNIFQKKLKAASYEMI